MRSALAPFALLLVFLLPACTAAPETPRERLVAAEATYKAALLTVQDMAATGALDDVEAREKVRLAITSARSALDAWHANPDVTDAASTALTALQALRTILNSITGPPT